MRTFNSEVSLQKNKQNIFIGLRLIIKIIYSKNVKTIESVETLNRKQND